MDRPFIFKLERVRALRERKEELAKEELAASLAHRLRGEAMLHAASLTLEEARRQQRELSGVPVTAQDLQARQAFIERAERERESASLDLDRRDAEVDARRMALQSAAREREVLERLKDRRRDQHRKDSERREGALLDEVALGIHRRRGVAL
jgi:flagellar protein FliJ